MPTMEIVDVPIEQEAAADDQSVEVMSIEGASAAVAAAPTTAAAAASQINKKRKITPPPANPSNKKKTKKKSSKTSKKEETGSGKSQLTLGAFFGVTKKAKPTPLAKENNNKKTSNNNSKSSKPASKKAASKKSTTTASSSSSEPAATKKGGAAGPAAAATRQPHPQPLDSARKKAVRSIVVGIELSSKSTTTTTTKPTAETAAAANNNDDDPSTAGNCKTPRQLFHEKKATSNNGGENKGSNDPVTTQQEEDDDKQTTPMETTTATADDDNNDDEPVSMEEEDSPDQEEPNNVTAEEEEEVDDSSSVVDPTDTSATSNETTTQATSNTEQTTTKAPSAASSVQDLATTKYGLDAGARIEVQWQLDDPDQEKGGTLQVWWGATLLPVEDNRTTADGKHTIRVLDYDAMPEHGFDDRATENVVFGNRHTVSGLEDDAKRLPFRLCSSKTPRSKKTKTATTPAAGSRKKSSAKKSPAAALGPLSDKAQQWVEKKDVMYQTYTKRALDLLQRCRQPLPEEQGWNIDLPNKDDDDDEVTSWDGASFPDFALKALLALIEGATEPLSVLAATCTERLNQHYYGPDNDSNKFTGDVVTAKLKLVASRKNYVKNAAIVEGSTATCLKSANLFEDTSPDHMWRWEVAVIDLLPEASLVAVKKARAARRKLANYLNAVTKLLQQLTDSMKHLRDADESKLTKAMAKVSQEEERVLKYEREEEKVRLAAETKAAQNAAKQAAKRQKEQEKEAKAAAKLQKEEEKKQKKLAAAEEKQRKKDLAAELKEQKAQAERKAQAKKNAALAKQRNKMMSFFSVGKKKASDNGSNKVSSTSPLPKAAASPSNKDSPKTADAEEPQPMQVDEETNAFDVQAFRAQIGSGTVEKKPFADLSPSARASRRRRTTKVTVPVFVMVVPEDDDPFAPVQPFAEQRDVTVCNKYKFLSFSEDVRPAYHGTWSKTSRQVTGKTPFRKDTEGHLDYDVDSEAEWEEGDDEVGEDVDVAGDDEEDKDDEEGSLGDGWLAAEDELDEELDEETKALRRKQLQQNADPSKQKEQLAELTVCIVAPTLGKPCSFDGSNDTLESQLVEGYSMEEAHKAMESHVVETLSETPVCLDAFPPPLVDESSDNPEGGSQQREMTEQDKKTFARFVHNCTFGSKEKVVDELRSAHPSVTSSRAQALRMLDSIAEKIKSPTGGVYWRVKLDALSSLGMESLATEDTSAAQQETLKLVAESVHHGLFTSKEKAVEHLRSKPSIQALSRAECVRLVDALAEKKKHPASGVYWQVKDDVRESLGLTHLPADPPQVTAEAKASTSPTAKDTTATPAAASAKNKKKNSGANGSSSGSGSKKRKSPDQAVVGSAKLLASFLKKKKTDT